jgi:hypothetical protein
MTALDLYARQNPAAKGVDPERFIDQSLLRELERGGYFGTLASGENRQMIRTRRRWVPLGVFD